MGGKKIKALTSCGRSDWVNSRTENKERTLFLFNNLLTGCPVPKASAVRKHLPALDSVDNSLALNCIQSLFADLDEDRFYVNYELRGVAKHLIGNGFADGGIPSSNIEFLAFTKTPIGMLKDGYGLFPDKDKKAIAISDAKPYDAMLTLDGLYRHLRNSIAHGQFAEVKRKSASNGKREPFLYFQDTNAKGQISARMFLSYKRIKLIGELPN